MTVVVPAVVTLALLQSPPPSTPLAHAMHATTLREAVAHQHVVASVGHVPRRQTTPTQLTNPVGKQIAYGIIGAVAGFFAGGTAGGAIDGTINRTGDERGLAGFVIGGFIGAPVGAVVGVLLAR